LGAEIDPAKSLFIKSTLDDENHFGIINSITKLALIFAFYLTQDLNQ